MNAPIDTRATNCTGRVCTVAFEAPMLFLPPQEAVAAGDVPVTFSPRIQAW